MLVILKRVFFCGGNRYRSIGKSAVEIPDKYKDILPSGAVIVDSNNDPIDADAPEDITEEEAKARDEAEAHKENEAPYVNPAHEGDAERQFAEAFSKTNTKASKEVNDVRKKLKGAKK